MKREEVPPFRYILADIASILAEFLDHAIRVADAAESIAKHLTATTNTVPPSRPPPYQQR
jgi:hypothetical protein